MPVFCENRVYVTAGGKVYVGTRRGDFWVLSASKNKKVISSIDMGSPLNGTPTAADGVLYITTMGRLYAIRHAPRGP